MISRIVRLVLPLILLTSCGSSVSTDTIIWGAPSAPKTIHAYLDFQCPACKSFFETMYPEIERDYILPGKIQFVFHHAPKHPKSFLAHEAFLCSREQGKEREMASLLFRYQDSNGLSTYKKNSDELGMNRVAFTECLDSERYKPYLTTELKHLEDLGITGTPTLTMGNTILPALGEYTTMRKYLEK